MPTENRSNTEKKLCIRDCRECGSTALTWQTHNKNVGHAQHSRLTTQDVQCLLVLGCDECSETLAVLTADQVAAWLTDAMQIIAGPEITYGPTPGCKHCEEAERCRLTDCPECDAQLHEDVNGDGVRPDT